MSNDYIVVRDADTKQLKELGWLEEQLKAAAQNLSNRPLQRRGPFEISDQIIEDLNEKFSLK